MTSVVLSNGQKLNFPDSMSQDDIKSVLRRKFPSSRQNAQENKPESLINRMGNFAEQNINQPIERNIVNPAMEAIGGAVQGTANVPSGIYNLGRSAANMIPGVNLPEAKTLDLVPHTLASQAGNIGAFLSNPAKIASEIPMIANTARNAMKIPMIAEGMSKAANFLKGNPLTSKVAGNALLGAGFSPENPVSGAALGGSVPIAGKALESISPVLKNAFSKVNPKDVAKNVQSSHDKLEKYSNELFNKVGQEVENRGINIVPIDKALISEMEQFLPKTRATKNLIKSAETGDYSALRKAQSELWHRGTARKSSVLPSERDAGEEILDLRDKINESIADHFKNSGHEDLSNMLNEARKNWHQLKETYYGENVPSSISKMVQKGHRKIPTNLMKTLSEESEPMKRILESNPMILENLELFKNKKDAINMLKKIGLGAGLVGGGVMAQPLVGKAKEIGNSLL